MTPPEATTTKQELFLAEFDSLMQKHGLRLEEYGEYSDDGCRSYALVGEGVYIDISDLFSELKKTPTPK